MPGLHECPRCGYRFEYRAAMETHLEACEGDANGQETGRRFLVDSNDGGEIIAAAWGGTESQASLDNMFADIFANEDDAQIAIWTEYKDADGELWYVSDHEEYTLSAEEFGPIPAPPA